MMEAWPSANPEEGRRRELAAAGNCAADCVIPGFRADTAEHKGSTSCESEDGQAEMQGQRVAEKMEGELVQLFSDEKEGRDAEEETVAVQVVLTKLEDEPEHEPAKDECDDEKERLTKMYSERRLSCQIAFIQEPCDGEASTSMSGTPCAAISFEELKAVLEQERESRKKWEEQAKKATERAEAAEEAFRQERAAREKCEQIAREALMQEEAQCRRAEIATRALLRLREERGYQALARTEAQSSTDSAGGPSSPVLNGAREDCDRFRRNTSSEVPTALTPTHSGSGQRSCTPTRAADREQRASFLFEDCERRARESSSRDESHSSPKAFAAEGETSSPQSVAGTWIQGCRRSPPTSFTGLSAGTVFTDGRSASFEGRWRQPTGEVCSIVGGVLIWPDGQKVPIKSGINEFSMMHEGTLCTAKVVDKRLEWDDGDVWRLEEYSSRKIPAARSGTAFMRCNSVPSPPAR